MPKTDNAVEGYEKQVGMRHYSSFKYFEKYIQKKYGKQKVADIFEVINLKAEDEYVDVYESLYESLDISIDFLSFNGDLHKQYLRWFSAQEFQQPAKILDIACGNGYLTCFYANKFPESDVVGIDASPRAVECANELTRRLKLQNVRFDVVDVAAPEFESLPSGYDLITAITAFNEIIHFPSPDSSQPIRMLLQQFRETVSIAPLNKIPELLLPEVGTFLSLERWPTLPGFGWWVSAIQNAGLFLDLAESSQIRFKSLMANAPEQYPILLCKKKSEECEQSLDDIIAYWLMSKHRSSLDKFRTFDSHDTLAEAAFIHINPKVFRNGIKAIINEWDVRRLEVWQAGPFLLFFQYDMRGHRVLEVLPSIFYKQLIERLDFLADEFREHSTVIPYDKSEVNWE